uniref:Uncharacterized protein n=1 Tax=Anguilla anguilla TaxID=7936 RepID=A0A0E9T956_ANGAN
MKFYLFWQTASLHVVFTLNANKFASEIQIDISLCPAGPATVSPQWYVPACEKTLL